MAKYAINEIRINFKLLIDDIPYQVISNEFIKPGKGQAFNRIKLRNLINGNFFEKTFKSTEILQSANIIEIDVQYLFSDAIYVYFMNIKNFEQFQIKKDVILKEHKWLKNEEICKMMLWDGRPISIIPPNFIELKIIQTSPVIRKNSSFSGGKKAKLENGIIIRVPLFIQEGEIIKIDTRTGTYVSRIK